MTRQGYQREDWRILTLNEAVEHTLSKILRFGFDIDRKPADPGVAKSVKDQILVWAKHIANEIPGYSNWEELYDFTFDSLWSPDAVPGEDATPIGTEADLVDRIGDFYLVKRYGLLRKEVEKDDLSNHALSLMKARYRQDVLYSFPAPYSDANPMPNDLALLFRKVRYTYKLRECLLSQVGYYTGAFELAADMDDDFEFQMYLIQMKLRRPDRLHTFNAPKMMKNYTTDPGSLLPWNNQMSFSYPFDACGPQQVPILGVNCIERRLVDVLRFDKENKKWADLCSLLHWNTRDPELVGELYRVKRQFAAPAQTEHMRLVSEAKHFFNGNLTLTDCGFKKLALPLILTLMIGNETKQKEFYDFLGFNWLDEPPSKEDNIFSEEYEKRARKAPRTGTMIGYHLAHLLESDTKDPRITLALASYYPHSKTNFVFTPEAASVEYHSELKRLSERELDQLFDNILAYPRTESYATKLDVVVNQAINAARSWQTSAVENHRPVYTGVSGQMLAYARILLSSSEDPSRSCEKSAHPTLEQLRLTLLAGLIGFNRNHTYDECMTASHGLMHGGITLEYKDRGGYRDIIDSEDPFIRDVIGKQLLDSMVAIGKEVIANFEEVASALDPPLPGWDGVVGRWFKDTTGRDFPFDK